MRGQYIGTARFISVAGLTAAMSLGAAGGDETKRESKCSVAPESARAKEIMALLSSNGFRTIAKVGDLSGDKPVYYHLLELDPPTKGQTR
jgi:hypothetical protein